MSRFAFASVLVLLLLASASFALEISTDKKTYLKGETIVVSGTNATGAVSITITNGCRVLFSEVAGTEGGNFSRNFTTTFLEPRGEWLINASSGGENAGASVMVNAPREATYYLVKFTSPPGGIAFQRTEKVKISVYITDSAAPLSGAGTRAWVGCNQVNLAETGPGVYEYEYALPVNEKTGDAVLYVTAEGGKTAKFGGENSVVFKVANASINLAFASPGGDSYNVGDRIPIEVAATYPGGVRAEGALVSIMVKEKTIPVELKESGVYIAEYDVKPEDQGSLSISAEASDEYGNAGSASYKPINVGGWFQWFIWSNIVYILVGAVAILSAGAYLSMRARTQLSGDALERRKIEILEMEKQLQTDYIQKGLLDRPTYEKRMSEYETQLAEVENRLKEVKGGK